MRPRKLFLLLALLALLTACRDAAVSPRDASSETHPAVDLVIHNARIYTVNQHQPWSQAVAIKNGKFVRLGKDSELAALPARRRLDLQQRLLLPAMVDGHSHPGYVSVEDFGEVNGETPEALLSSVKKYADQHPEQKWLRLCCWPTTMFVNGDQGPKKEVLDAILPDRLVWFESETAHDFWLNSAALAELGVSRKTPDPKPGLAMYARDKNGDPTGWVKEGAGVQHFSTQFALSTPDHIKRHKDRVADILQHMSKHGLTAIFDAGNKGYGDHVYDVIATLEREGRLPLRYFGTYQIFTPERAKIAVDEVKRYQREYGGELLRFNSVKLFMDGISANQSASYTRPYLGSNIASEPLLTTEELTALLLRLHEERLDLMVHSIGDRATRTVLDAVQAARSVVQDDFYPRVTVAHLALVDPVDIPRISALGVVANFSPWWFGVESSSVVSDLLGKDRYNAMYPARSVFESGATVTFSSDEWWGGDMLPTYLSPYLGMQTGHTRQYPKEWWQTADDGVRLPASERLTLEQLVTGYTRHGAYQLRLEDQLGSVEVGKAADFIVLDQDLFTMKPDEIWRLQPSLVVMEGKVMQGAYPE
ncbi:MAG: amidohydrolase family protein [Luminiphilus sp.]|jgi:predicted amidohydrolase YtcJ|nr:amidohydrolase family protein [Luminiphilus sp.]